MGKGLKKEDSAALKGIAILLMVYHHCFRTADRFKDYDLIFAPFTMDQVLATGLFAKICVSLFAFVTGFGLMYSYTQNQSKKDRLSAGGWVTGHVLSTASGYWFLAPPAYLIRGLAYGFGYPQWGDSRFEKVFAILADGAGLSGLLDTKSVNGSWWYMSAALVFIVAFPVLASVVERYGGVVCAGLVFLLPRVLDIGYQGGQSALSFTMILVLGMLCCKYDFFARFHAFRLLKRERMNDVLKCGVLAVLLIFGFWSYRRMSMSLFWEYHFAAVPFVVILFCVEYLFRIGFLYRFLGFLGKHSLNIWLVHTFVRDYLKRYVWSVKYFLLVPLVILLLSVLLSFAINGLKKYSGYDALIGKLREKLR